MLTKAELQRLRSLRDKKNRETLGLFVVEGEKVVGELLAAGFPFIELYTTPAWLAASADSAASDRAATRNASTRIAGTAENPRAIHTAAPNERGNAVQPAGRAARGGPVAGAAVIPPPRRIEITADEMARASHFPTPSSVLAVGRLLRRPLDPGALARGRTLALDGVQDAGNVGTLLRIADWFAFDRVLLSADCADLFHQKVINASMGSFARMPAHAVDLAPELVRARELGTPILGCDLEGEDVHALPPLPDVVVVIGSEGRGLSPAVAACLTRRVTIPRYGVAESLNAAIAAAIVCDNLRRTG